MQGAQLPAIVQLLPTQTSNPSLPTPANNQALGTPCTYSALSFLAPALEYCLLALLSLCQ